MGMCMISMANFYAFMHRKVYKETIRDT